MSLRVKAGIDLEVLRDQYLNVEAEIEIER